MIDPKKTKLYKTFKHKSPLLGGQFDPSGKFAFAGSQDSSVQRWEIATGKNVGYVGHKSWVRALAFDQKNQRLLSADYNGKILVWPIKGEKPQPIKTIDAHTGFVRALTVSDDSRWLASCGNDRKVRLWSLPVCEPVRDLTGHGSHVYNVGFHPDGKHLVSADLKGNIKVWNFSTGEEVGEMNVRVLYKYDPTFRADIGGVRSLCISTDGETIACAGITNVSNAFAGVGNPLIVHFDWKTKKSRQLMKPAQAFRGCMWGVRQHSDGFTLGVAGGSGGGGLWFWKDGQEKSVHFIKLPTNARDLDLLTSSNQIVIAFTDGSLRLYNLL